MTRTDSPLLLDLPVGPVGTDLTQIVETDGGNIAGIWSTEVGHDPYLALVPVAERTNRLVMGTAITVTFPRSPMVHAQSAWDLQRVSKGRFILGLGAQVRAHNERRYSVAGDHPVERMQDAIRAIRAIWTCWQEGGALSYEGPYYHHTLMTPFFNPGSLDLPSPYPKIYLAAVSERMLDLAAREVEGIHLHPLHTKEYLSDIVQVRCDDGRSERMVQGDIELSASVMIAAGESDEEISLLREQFRGQIAFYASTPAYRHVVEHAGFGDVCDDLHRMSVRGEWEKMPALIPDALLDEVVISGRWDEIPRLLHARYQGLVDRITPYIATDIPRWNSVAGGLADLH
ncbi:MAG: TIGR03617 family F420-dependent LLM class oxidoreductase [Candidatus Dormibacteria bacterium]